jgi:D-galactose 1-dehydrogenase
MSLRIGLVGLGQIARKQHLPAIAGSADFTLAGLASLDAPEAEAGLRVHPDHAAMFAFEALDAVAICTPPAARFAVARDALLAGKHVLLEKPPGLGVAEVAALARLAASQGRVMFTAWHSQFNTAVDRAAAFLDGRRLASLRIDWNEDFRQYHPGQDWIWRSDGFGVFDMGINGLSILSRILPDPPFVRAADLLVAANHGAPLAAVLRFATLDGPGPMEAHFDWRGTGPEQREVRLTTTDGHALALLRSGGQLTIDGVEVVAEARREYKMLYARFADLIRRGTSDIDTIPLQMTSDAFLMGRRIAVEAFDA